MRRRTSLWSVLPLSWVYCSIPALAHTTSLSLEALMNCPVIKKWTFITFLILWPNAWHKQGRGHFGSWFYGMQSDSGRGTQNVSHLCWFKLVTAAASHSRLGLSSGPIKPKAQTTQRAMSSFSAILQMVRSSERLSELLNFPHPCCLSVLVSSIFRDIFDIWSYMSHIL